MGRFGSVLDEDGSGRGVRRGRSQALGENEGVLVARRVEWEEGN